MAYLYHSVLQSPPPGGWSDEQLIIDTLQVFNRSENAINIFCHLPYMSKNIGIGKYEVYYETKARSHLRDTDNHKGVTAESCRRGRLSDWIFMPFQENSPAGIRFVDSG